MRTATRRLQNGSGLCRYGQLGNRVPPGEWSTSLTAQGFTAVIANLAFVLLTALVFAGISALSAIGTQPFRWPVTLAGAGFGAFVAVLALVRYRSASVVWKQLNRPPR